MPDKNSDTLPRADDYLAMMIANDWLDMGYSAIVDHISRLHLSGGRILDLGCGPGIFTHYLGKVFAADVVGIDPSQDMIDTAIREYAHDRVQFIFGETSEVLKPFAKTFDVVVSCFVLMHLPHHDSHQILAKSAFTSLRSGGTAIFLDMNPASVGIQFASVRNGEPNQNYSPGDKMLTTVKTPGGTINVYDRFWPADHYLTSVRQAGFSAVEAFTLPPPPYDKTEADQFCLFIAEK
ncbi:class I SAM-dependent methyltransferase [Aestuariibius sp. 2305UL40-4]|uniref:class I SAM-dependent methyltransferase n=1 Tax=Aestuariibius violaceus TaxID=3234132 RepID=UPI00345E68F4